MSGDWNEPPVEPVWDGEITRDLTPRVKKKERQFKIEIKYYQTAGQWKMKAGNFWYGGPAFTTREAGLKRIAEIKTANTNPPIYSVKPVKVDATEGVLDHFIVYLNGQPQAEYRLVGPKDEK